MGYFYLETITDWSQLHRTKENHQQYLVSKYRSKLHKIKFVLVGDGAVVKLACLLATLQMLFMSNTPQLFSKIIQPMLWLILHQCFTLLNPASFENLRAILYPGVRSLKCRLNISGCNCISP